MFKNRRTFAKVIIKHQVAYFFETHRIYVSLLDDADARWMIKLTVMSRERYLNTAAAAAAVLKMIVCLSCFVISGVSSLNPGASVTSSAKRCSKVFARYWFISQQVATIFIRASVSACVFVTDSWRT